MGRWIGIALLSALVGCGDDDNLSLDEWFEGNIDSACEYYVECGLFASVESCLSFFDSRVGSTNPTITAAVENGSVTFDGSAAKDCLDRWGSAGCELDAIGDIDACDEVLTGTLDNDEPCFVSQQCVSEYCESPIDCTMQCCVGTCLDAPPVGEPCPQFTCATGAYCNFDDDTCYALKPLDALCEFDSECEAPYVCLALTGDSARCLEAPNAGDPCDPTNATLTCNGWGLTCDSATQTCVEQLLLGNACDPDNDLCSWVEAWCLPDTQTCAPLPGPGESCELTICRFPNSCDFDADPWVCVAPLPNGELCDFDFDCESFYCGESTGTCEDEPVCVTAARRQPARARHPLELSRLSDR